MKWIEELLFGFAKLRRTRYITSMKLTQEAFAIFGVGAGPAVGLGCLQISLHSGLSRRIDSLAVGQAEVCE